MSVSQDIIYRRAKYEREDHLMHVYNKFQGLIQLTKNDKNKKKCFQRNNIIKPVSMLLDYRLVDEQMMGRNSPKPKIRE